MEEKSSLHHHRQKAGGGSVGSEALCNLWWWPTSQRRTISKHQTFSACHCVFKLQHLSWMQVRKLSYFVSLVILHIYQNEWKDIFAKWIVFEYQLFGY